MVLDREGGNVPCHFVTSGLYSIGAPAMNRRLNKRGTDKPLSSGIITNVSLSRRDRGFVAPFLGRNVIYQDIVRPGYFFYATTHPNSSFEKVQQKSECCSTY